MSRSRTALVLAALLAFPAASQADAIDLPVDVPVDVPNVEAVASADTASAASGPVAAKINRVRGRHGLRPLRVSRSLARSSRRFGRYLMRINQFRHDSHIWASSRFHRKGEVLAMHSGWRPRPAAAVRAWMHSPVHRAVLLNGAYRYIGAAPVRGRFGSRLATIWVAQVGR